MDNFDFRNYRRVRELCEKECEEDSHVSKEEPSAGVGKIHGVVRIREVAKSDVNSPTEGIKASGSTDQKSPERRPVKSRLVELFSDTIFKEGSPSMKTLESLDDHYRVLYFESFTLENIECIDRRLQERAQRDLVQPGGKVCSVIVLAPQVFVETDNNLNEDELKLVNDTVKKYVADQFPDEFYNWIVKTSRRNPPDTDSDF